MGNATPEPAVDAAGRPTLDPTENVKERLRDAVKRQDDLRTQESRHVREIADLRAVGQESVALIRAEFLATVALIRAEYQRELRVGEKERIDAIRAVDVGAVQRAAEVAAAAAATLAATVATSAEAMRAQVAAAATAAQTSLAAALVPIQEAIAELRQSQWQGVGEKTQVVEQRQEGVAKGANVGLWIAAAATVSAGFIGISGIIITLLVTMK